MIKNVFALIPPKFTHSNYEKVINAIFVERLLRSKRKRFTLDEIKRYIQEDIEKIDNPFYRFSCIGALEVIGEVFEKFREAGILIRRGKFYKIAEAASNFYEWYKNIKKSSTKICAWAIVYLYNNGERRLKAERLIQLLAYDDFQSKNLLSDLPIWVNYKIERVLERKGNIWHLIHKPHRSTKPILVLDLIGRIYKAILVLSEKKTDFSTTEIIGTLHELEKESIIRALKRIGLQEKNGEWIIDENIVIKAKNLLELSGTKAKPAMLEIRNPPWLRFVRIETRNLYYGDPFVFLNEAISDIFECDKSVSDAEEFKERCTKIIDRYNEILEPFGVALKLRRSSFRPLNRPYRPYAIRIIRKNEGRRKIEEIQGLFEKYKFIQVCRMPEVGTKSIWSIVFDYHKLNVEELINYLESKRQFFKEEIDKSYQKIILFLSWWFKEAKEILGRDEMTKFYFENSFFFSSALSEIVNGLLTSFLSAYYGFFRAAYKGFRELLEWIALSAFIDLSTIRYKIKGSTLLRNFYREMVENGDWHRALAGQTNIAGYIGNLGEVKNFIKNIVYEPNKDFFKRKGIKYEDFSNALIDNLNLPILIISTSDVLCKKHAKGRKYYVKFSEIQPYIYWEVTQILSSKFGITPNEIPFLHIKTSCTHKEGKRPCSEDDNYEAVFALRIPRTSLLLDLVLRQLKIDIFTAKKIKAKYNEYCCFVHPYPQTKQYAPFTSYDEVKIWMDELDTFLTLLSEILCKLFRFYRSGFKKTFLDEKHELICGKCRYMENNFEKITVDIIRKKRWKKT